MVQANFKSEKMVLSIAIGLKLTSGA